MTAAVCITAVGVSVDVELSTGRRSRADISSEWYVLEAIVLGILSLECSVLIISKGLVLLPEAYLRDPLNVVDILVTAVSFVCLLEFNEKRWDDSAVISLLRATRGLRVLRLVKVG